MRNVGDFQVAISTGPQDDVSLYLRYAGSARLSCNAARHVTAWVHGVEMEGVVFYSEATREVTNWKPRYRHPPELKPVDGSIVLQIRKAKVEQVALGTPGQREALAPVVVKASAVTTYRLTHTLSPPRKRVKSS
ncbi:hypothetical protein ACHHYP_03129 [Achlya hypogyna]|uniref:Uncharacterized protein n=1 Tax=Achlya hypogyna TaxID=1202772 RepID=A0A1V9Z4E1_ACHHY|nr:hypothetical protein ACHHYP_03129 [Achlya hypogyna]